MFAAPSNLLDLIFFCIKSGHYVPTSRLQALNALSRFRVLQRAHSGSAEFSGHAITARSRPHVQIHVAFCAKPIPLFHSEVGANACLSDENQARHEKSDARSFCSSASWWRDGNYICLRKITAGYAM